MSVTKTGAMCSNPWCRDTALTGCLQCARHLTLSETVARVNRKPQPAEQQFEYDWRCFSCNRGEYLKLTEAQARMRRPARCSQEFCRGRMMLVRADVGNMGGSFNPAVPLKIARPKVGRP